jgi:hypothetical protein
MRETIEKKISKPVSCGFLFGNGMLLTPDEMKVVERYGFSFNNGMLLTPDEIEIMENMRVIHAAAI